MIKFAKIAVMVAVIAITAIFAFVSYNIHEFKKQDKEVIIEVNNGEGLYHFTKKLDKAGLIYNKFLFKFTAVLMRHDKSLKPGEYILNTNMGNFTILDKVSKGQVFYRKITIPEGLTTKEIVSLVNSNKHLKGEISIELKEGVFLPETYYFRKGESKDSILSQMQGAMQKGLELIWATRNINQLRGYIDTPEELVNLASIVEKEALIQSEKSKIAAVYLNRLKRGMRLQADPTVIYGAKNYKGDITYKMLKERTPYNTYRIKGLPKTPISNPDLISLQAVANPAPVDYLYFVADGKGGHIFAKTYAEHRKNVKRYLKSQKLK